MSSVETTDERQGWDVFWRGSLAGAAFEGQGVSHPAISRFWTQQFENARQKFIAPQLIDLASGTGAVLEHARSAFSDDAPRFTSIDLSPSAARILRQRAPDVVAVIADVGKLPFFSGRFDIVTSQFGIEYAGVEAVHEAARLVARGGRFCALLHHRNGRIFEECRANLGAIEAVQQSRFVPLAASMFEAGFGALQGAARDDYERAARRLAPAIEALESVMMRYGRRVAGDLVTQLYDQVADIHEHLARYDASEVRRWLESMTTELEAYAARMSAMCEAAIEVTTFESICRRLESVGFVCTRAGSLDDPLGNQPLAWMLVADRTAPGA